MSLRAHPRAGNEPVPIQSTYSLISNIIHDPHPFWVGFVVLPVSLLGFLIGAIFAKNDEFHPVFRTCGGVIMLSAVLFWKYG
jgi:hypothetical protein